MDIEFLGDGNYVISVDGDDENEKPVIKPNSELDARRKVLEEANAEAPVDDLIVEENVEDAMDIIDAQEAKEREEALQKAIQEEVKKQIGNYDMVHDSDFGDLINAVEEGQELEEEIFEDAAKEQEAHSYSEIKKKPKELSREEKKEIKHQKIVIYSLLTICIALAIIYFLGIRFYVPKALVSFYENTDGVFRTILNYMLDGLAWIRNKVG